MKYFFSRALILPAFLLLVCFLNGPRRGTGDHEKHLKDNPKEAVPVIKSVPTDTADKRVEEGRKNICFILEQVSRSSESVAATLQNAIEAYGSGSQLVKDWASYKDRQDSVNRVEVLKLMDRYGWIGKKMMGPQNNYTLYITIQNSGFDVQEKYLSLMEEAVKAGDLDPQCFAVLVDRKGLVQHHKQVYGTQLVKGSDDQYKLSPVIDAENLNRRRMEIGLGPVEGYREKLEKILKEL